MYHGHKIIFEQDQSLIPNYLIKDYTNYLNNKLFCLEAEIDVPWMNLPMVLKELEDLKADVSKEDKVKELKDYFEHISEGLVYG